jgi:hypothetical protein
MLLSPSTKRKPESILARLSFPKEASSACLRALFFAVMAIATSTVSAQQNRLPHVWPMYKDNMAPGVIGQSQIQRRPQAYGYFQPVEITGPEGVRISLATSGTFDEPQPAPFRAGLLVGAPYRIRVGGIPFEDGQELYPTIEIIDRLYAPSEREHRMPIPIELDENDLAAALKGDMVTRVIYLEDSEIAEPISYAEGSQRVRDVSATEDTLQVADQLGRPVAILRIGSRVPNETGNADNTEFLFGSPAWFPIKEIPNKQKMIESGVIPRTEMPPVIIQTSQPKTTPRPPAKETRSIGG